MIVRPLTSLAFAAAFIAALIGCGSGESTNNRTNAGGRNYGTGASETGTGNKATKDGTSTGNTGKLASWLFTESEAAAINPLVLPFESAGGDDSPLQDPSRTKTRDFISEILSDMMVIPAHAPGRNFKVTVTNDSSPNASALNESLVINKGIIEFAPNLSLALVVCHEAAHSARNHSAQAMKQMTEYENKNKAAADALDQALNDVVTASYNPTTQKYTHKESDYKKIKPLWDAFWGDFVEYQKRFESEADIVGGRMCANAGFTRAEVEEGFTSLFKLFQEFTKNPIEPGSYSVREDELGDFLQSVYGEDSHPTDKEREEQIIRVRNVFKEGNIKDIASRWKEDFPDSGLKLVPDFSLIRQGRFKHRSPIDDAVISRTQRSVAP